MDTPSAPAAQTLEEGVTVRALFGGRIQTVKVTAVLADLDPPRYEGDVVYGSPDDWRYADEGDHVWGYVSDILEVL